MSDLPLQMLNHALNKLCNHDGLASVYENFETYCDYLVLTRTGLSMKGVDNAPDWYGYEYIIWNAGFQFLEPVLKKKDYRGKNILLDGVVSMSLNPKYGRGRQSLIMLIGKYGSVDYAPAIGRLLNDEEVLIQVIYALERMKDFTHFEKIKTLADGDKCTPQRTRARKYVKNILQTLNN